MREELMDVLEDDSMEYCWYCRGLIMVECIMDPSSRNSSVDGSW